MKTRTESDYNQLFQYMNAEVGRVKVHIIKSDLENALQNAIQAAFKFDFFKSCRFHSANVIRNNFKDSSPVAKLMFRKNREQNLSVEEHLVQTSFTALKSLMLLQPALKTQLLDHIKKINNTCQSKIQHDLAAGQF